MLQDLYNMVGNKIANEAGKAIIRNSLPPRMSEHMCNAIDGQERVDHFLLLQKVYNEWIMQQQLQQVVGEKFWGGIRPPR